MEFSNYRPISLLHTISKIFKKKSSLTKHMTILPNKSSSIKVNTVSQKNIQPNMLH